jgi:putative hydrolase
MTVVTGGDPPSSARGVELNSRFYDACVSDDGPIDPDNPFGGMPFFGDLSKMFGAGAQSSGPMNWDAAKQFAVNLANGGTPEPNIDPTDRVRLAELSRIAELQVATSTGLDLTVDGASPIIVPVTRAEWAHRTLNDYRELLERLATGLQAPPDDESESDPAAQLFSGLMKMMAPMMMAMSAGSMVGHLAERALGGHDLPIPRPRSAELIVVGPNIRKFSDEWSVPFDDIGLWVSVHELLHHALFGIPHVRDTLNALLGRYVDGFQTGQGTGLEEKLGGFDASGGMEEMQKQLSEVLGDPEVLLGAMRSPEHDAVIPQLESLIAVIVGWVDHHLDRTATKLVGASSQVTEALRRRRVTAAPQDRFVERMLGLDLRADLIAQGQAFVAGVIERGGDEALARVWELEENIPTPNEVSAPGLWLARIDL